MSDPDVEARRQALYAEFKDSGIANQIKAKMRTEILQELKKRHDAALVQIGTRPNMKCGVVDHMIAQYLQKHGYHYSLSIYAAESGVEMTQAPTPMETLRTLGLNGWPKFVQIVSDALSKNTNQGLLLVLLESIAAFLNSVSQESGTDPASQRYLKQLEASYTEAMKSFQQEVQEVKQRHAEQIEEEVLLRMERFRSQEIENIKQKEAETWRQQIENHKANLDDAYQTRLQALKEREACVIEQLNKQRQENERAVQAQQEQLSQGELFLKERQWSLERAFVERQAHIDRIEQQLKQREQSLLVAEQDMRDRLLSWSNKERQFEIQAHLKAQEHLASEHETIMQSKLALETDWSNFERERRELMKETELQKKRFIEMEDRLRISQDNVIQLKENETILTKKLKRMQNDAFEFQKALLKVHNVPFDLPLLPQAPGPLGNENRIQLVKDLLVEVGRSHEHVTELKSKAKKEVKRRTGMEVSLRSVKEKKKEWKMRCKHLESLANEAIEANEKTVSKLTQTRKYVEEVERENHDLRVKLDKCSQQLIHAKAHATTDVENSKEDPFIPTDSVCCTENLIPYTKARRRDRCQELERDEQELEQRLRTFKESIKTYSASMSPWNLHAHANSWQSADAQRQSTAVLRASKPCAVVPCGTGKKFLGIEGVDETSDSDLDVHSDAAESSSITESALVEQETPRKAILERSRTKTTRKEHGLSERIAKQAEQLVGLLQGTAADESNKDSLQCSDVPPPAMAQNTVTGVSEQNQSTAQHLLPPFYPTAVTCGDAWNPSFPLQENTLPSLSLPSPLNPFLAMTTGVSHSLCSNVVDLPVTFDMNWKTEHVAAPISGIPFLPLPSKFAELFHSSQPQIHKSETLPVSNATATAGPSDPSTPISDHDRRCLEQNEDAESADYTEDYEQDQTEVPGPLLQASIPQAQPQEMSSNQEKSEKGELEDASDLHPAIDSLADSSISEELPDEVVDEGTNIPESHHTLADEQSNGTKDEESSLPSELDEDLIASSHTSSR